MKRQFQQTADGSHTLYVPELDETYHSSHGALQEAMHVFIRHGLEFTQTENLDGLKILEMGLGTGLNAWLTAVNAKVPVEYTGIEAFPVEAEILAELNYASNSAVEEKELFQRISAAGWENFEQVSTSFFLRKLHSKLLDAHLLTNHFDLVYYDAFGPRAQQELWEMEPLKKVVGALRPGGVFVTYCAQGQFKRNLKSLGMSIESLPGPPGKREMTRAVKS